MFLLLRWVVSLFIRLPVSLVLGVQRKLGRGGNVFTYKSIMEEEHVIQRRRKFFVFQPLAGSQVLYAKLSLSAFKKHQKLGLLKN